MTAEIGRNVIVFYRSREELLRERQQISDDFDAAWDAISKEAELLKAAPTFTPPASVSPRVRAMADAQLRKLGLREFSGLGSKSANTGSAIGLVVSDDVQKRAAAIVAGDGIMAHIGRKMGEALARYSARLDEHKKLEKRSERFRQRLAQ